MQTGVCVHTHACVLMKVGVTHVSLMAMISHNDYENTQTDLACQVRGRLCGGV